MHADLRMADMKEELIYKDLTYQLNGLCFQVHNQLGRFCRERQYADALAILLDKAHIAYHREYEVPFLVEEKQLRGNRVDFMIEDKLILELKAKPLITREDYYQIQRYLQATGSKLGLIVNFRQLYLKPKRILNPKISNP